MVLERKFYFKSNSN